MRWKCFEKVCLDFLALRKGKIIKPLPDSDLNDSITYPTMISTKYYIEALGDAYMSFFF